MRWIGFRCVGVASQGCVAGVPSVCIAVCRFEFRTESRRVVEFDKTNDFLGLMRRVERLRLV